MTDVRRERFPLLWGTIREMFLVVGLGIRSIRVPAEERSRLELFIINYLFNLIFLPLPNPFRTNKVHDARHEQCVCVRWSLQSLVLLPNPVALSGLVIVLLMVHFS